MSSPQITVVGNVVDSPIRRRAGSGEVTKFRMASTDRWFDSAAGQWVDGDTFYVDVDCWSTLGGHVSSCVMKGDPVVVVGRISTSEYEVDGAKRSRPVMRASLVGHDLSKGSSKTFTRTPRAVVAEASTDVAAGAPVDTVPDDPGSLAAAERESEEFALSAGAPF